MAASRRLFPIVVAAILAGCTIDGQITEILRTEAPAAAPGSPSPSPLAPAKIGLAVPGEMLTGRCSAVFTAQLLSETDGVALASEDLPITLAFGASAAQIYSDAECKNPVTGVAIAKGSSVATFYLKYNVFGDLGLQVGAGSYLGSQASVPIIHRPERIDLMAGAPETSGFAEGGGSEVRMSNASGVTELGGKLYLTLYWANMVVRVDPVAKTMAFLVGSPKEAGSADGVGNVARFQNPVGITNDGTYLYVADSGNHTIRRIDPVSGAVITFSGQAGVAATVDGNSTTARYASPRKLYYANGFLYILSSASHEVRRLNLSTGAVTTFAGAAGTAGSSDGTGVAARFNSPDGLTSDGTFLYVTDRGNQLLRKIEIATGVVSTLAGGVGQVGAVDGPSGTARFRNPQGLLYAGGTIYVADAENHLVRTVDPTTGVTSTLMGSTAANGCGDGVGTSAKLSMPTDLLLKDGNIYIVDWGFSGVRRFSRASLATELVVGACYDDAWDTVDGIGPAARFNWIDALAADEKYLYATDWSGHAVRRYDIATREVVTLAGSKDQSGSADGVGSAAQFVGPAGVLVMGESLYVTDYQGCTLRKIDLATRAVTTVAGQASVCVAADGVGTAATFLSPSHLTALGTDIYMTDYSAHLLRKYDTLTGTVTTVAGQNGVAGTADGVGLAAQLDQPYGVATIGRKIYIAEINHNALRSYDVDTGQVVTIAGGSGGATIDGVGAAAQFSYPYGLATDGRSLYVADNGGSTIRKVDPATRQVTTFAGSPTRTGTQDGLTGVAALAWPSGIAVNKSGIFFADDGLNIRWIH